MVRNRFERSKCIQRTILIRDRLLDIKNETFPWLYFNAATIPVYRLAFFHNSIRRKLHGNQCLILLSSSTDVPIYCKHQWPFNLFKTLSLHQEHPYVTANMIHLQLSILRRREQPQGKEGIRYSHGLFCLSLITYIDHGLVLCRNNTKECAGYIGN
jgi:hypothetical protein